MGNRSAEKIKLTSFDDLFGGKPQQEPGENQVVSIPLAEIHSFPNHPFRVMDDEEMAALSESIKQHGVLVPAIVRRDKAGGYELIAGHRRKRGSELAGCSDMPALIRNLTDDEATIIMVDSNIQRENILPSEKAWAYRMKMEALKHQGVKGDGFTADLVGKPAGDGGRTVQRYIRLTYLKKELLEYVDQKKMPVMSGEKISFLTLEEQEWILDVTGEYQCFPSKSEAELLRVEGSKGQLSRQRIEDILVRKERISGVTLSVKQIRNYFPANYSKKQIEDVIFSLLDSWKEDQKIF